MKTHWFPKPGFYFLPHQCRVCIFHAHHFNVCAKRVVLKRGELCLLFKREVINIEESETIA